MIDTEKVDGRKLFYGFLALCAVACITLFFIQILMQKPSLSMILIIAIPLLFIIGVSFNFGDHWQQLSSGSKYIIRFLWIIIVLITAENMIKDYLKSDRNDLFNVFINIVLFVSLFVIPFYIGNRISQKRKSKTDEQVLDKD